MNSEQIKLLTTMKKLIREGKRRFEVRRDNDYLEELVNIGITEEDAWNNIMYLNGNLYFSDPKPSYLTTGKALIFKKKINGYLVYIKLKLEKYDGEDYTVCLSFHRDNGGR